MNNISGASARMLMSDPKLSAAVRASLDTKLVQADEELAKAQTMMVGGVEVDPRWRCDYGNRYVRVIDLVAVMKDEEREHHVFKLRDARGHYGDLIYIGPQLPNESRQVYRARLRKGVKTLAKA